MNARGLGERYIFPLHLVNIDDFYVGMEGVGAYVVSSDRRICK